MSAPASDIVAAARTWIGTPYRHQGTQLGAGTDCLGLVRGVWRETIGQEPEIPPAYSWDWAEAGPRELLWEALARHLVSTEGGPIEQGDVLLFRMRDGLVAKHLGIVSQTGDSPCFIHAYARHGVIESALSAPWARRIVARFQFPERSS